MKKTLIILLLIITIAACKKDAKVVTPGGIDGTWELRTVIGITIFNYAPGNSNLLQFNPDSTYINSQPQKASSTGVFHLVKNAYTIGQVKYDGLFYDSSKTGEIVQIQHDTLILTSPLQVADAGVALYVKIK